MVEEEMGQETYIFSYFYIIRMGVYACMSMYRVSVVPTEAREDPVTRVTDCYQWSHGY